MIEAFRDSLDRIRILITPTQYFAWQTLLLLSIFSWLMAILAEVLDAATLTVNILSTCSWISLTAAIWWALWRNPVRVAGFSISAWITGAVLCLFLFNPWPPERLRWALAAWPLISTAIRALPSFFRWDLEFKRPKPEVQQELVLILLLNLLLTSWILFYFQVQSWFGRYPSLLVNDFDRSAFVYDFSSDFERIPQGVLLLESAADALEQQLNGIPWPRTERWLLNSEAQVADIAREIPRAALYAPEESLFWKLGAPPPIGAAGGYRLNFRAYWRGPVARENGYYLEKSCQLTPQRRTRPAPPSRPSPSGRSPAVPPVEYETTIVQCDTAVPEPQWIDASAVD
ncbi:DUF5357 family protein [Romeria aff. gracilis LEGE 07310]|uniref:DUF5357 family protein n=1 Tax=Vasconcelosia minhoensis LEGE 07310 TaxID=915328 RepID=A0A8J7ASK3_9CYAN|nr:DUF5357 family protein [Romeria gracilis]MBE9079560.1 DUF5357 family protein [Romeria aff. gracilis LEGE 07310]